MYDLIAPASEINVNHDNARQWLHVVSKKPKLFKIRFVNYIFGKFVSYFNFLAFAMIRLLFSKEN